MFGAVSLQRQLRDAAFDDLNMKLAAWMSCGGTIAG
jgi:hypothetical protein